MRVSLYPHIKATNGGAEVLLDQILLDIKQGKWQDIALKVATEKDKEKRRKLKATAPYFTPTGTFETRNNNGIIQPSGIIAIDFDEITDIHQSFAKLCQDPYTFALFRSISGTGFCCLVRIDPKRHADAFKGLQAYYYNTYRLSVDLACSDLSRPRFVSYDPDLFVNKDSQLFKIYPKSETKIQQKQRADFSSTLHTEPRFEKLIQAVNTDITGDYHQWLQIAFALCTEFGVAGEDYFHKLSSYSANYNQKECSDQYRKCCKANRGDIKIGTIYYFASQHGIRIDDKEEQTAAKLAYYAKMAGKDIRKIIPSPTPSQQTAIEQVAKDPDYQPKETKQKTINLQEVIQWIKVAYNVRKNEITRFYERDGKELEAEDLNTMYIETKKVFEKLSREIFDTVLFSTFTETYNPITTYFDSLAWDGADRLTDITRTITSETGDLTWRTKMVTKWMIGIVQTIYTYEPNILNLVLVGKGNTGKTQWFKRLMPEPLRPYFANSQMDKGKDDEILMTQKLIIFDDEYSGKSKQDAKRIKMLLSTDSFTLREPYGKKNVTLRRIASFCGTCNETDVLNDQTGNRRIIVIESTGTFDFDLYNSIDKTQVFAQIKHLYDSGETAYLTPSEVALLNEYTEGRFSEVSIEGELLSKFFDTGHTFMTTSEIKDVIETYSKQHLSVKKLGMELRKSGFERVKEDGKYGYLVFSKETGHRENHPISNSFPAPF